MPIPESISRDHILRAIEKIKKEGVPPRRQALNLAMAFEGKKYPIKLIISWANVYANGEELNPNPSNFNSYMAREYLVGLGFNVVKI